jgi:hypothetical protein
LREGEFLKRVLPYANCIYGLKKTSGVRAAPREAKISLSSGGKCEGLWRERKERKEEKKKKKKPPHSISISIQKQISKAMPLPCDIPS